MHSLCSAGIRSRRSDEESYPAKGCVQGHINLEIWEFPEKIELDKRADRLGVRDADKTKKKKKEKPGRSLYLATAANINSYG